VLDECHISDTVEVIVDNAEITLRPGKRPREGWAKAARRIHENNEDRLFIDDMLDLNLDEWVW
jgi:antitoxin MazE